MKWKLTLKIITIVILSLIDMYLAYGTIGYYILGTQAPKIVGVESTKFMGMYLMSFTYGSIFLVLTIVIVVLGIKFFKQKKKL